MKKKLWSAFDVWTGVPDNDKEGKALKREWVNIEELRKEVELIEDNYQFFGLKRVLWKRLGLPKEEVEFAVNQEKEFLPDYSHYANKKKKELF